MTLKLSFLTAVAGLALVVTATAAGNSHSKEQWQKAMEARSAALNEQYGLGGTSQRTVDTYLLAMQARSEALNRIHGLGTSSYEQALQARSEGLNRIHGLGSSAPSQVVKSERVTESPSTRYEEALALRSQELNRRHELGTFAPPAIAPDAFERAVGNGPSGIETVHVRGDDFTLADPADVRAPIVAEPTGTEFEWPQIVMGLLVGIFLTVGIALTIRFTRTPLAH